MKKDQIVFGSVCREWGGGGSIRLLWTVRSVEKGKQKVTSSISAD